MPLHIAVTRSKTGQGQIACYLTDFTDSENDSAQQQIDRVAGHGREEILTIVKFPSDGRFDTDALRALAALCEVNYPEDDSIGQTLEALCVEVFECGRRFGREEIAAKTTK